MSLTLVTVMVWVGAAVPGVVVKLSEVLEKVGVRGIPVAVRETVAVGMDAF